MTMRSLLVLMCALALVLLTSTAQAAQRDCPGCRNVLSVPVEVTVDVVKVAAKVKEKVAARGEKAITKAVTASVLATKKLAKPTAAASSTTETVAARKATKGLRADCKRRPITRFVPLLRRSH